MSRSYRKPIYKDSSHDAKARSARIVRAHQRTMMNSHAPEYWEFPHRNALINQYDVCDWWFFSEEPEARRK